MEGAKILTRQRIAQRLVEPVDLKIQRILGNLVLIFGLHGNVIGWNPMEGATILTRQRIAQRLVEHARRYYIGALALYSFLSMTSEQSIPTACTIFIVCHFLSCIHCIICMI